MTKSQTTTLSSDRIRIGAAAWVRPSIADAEEVARGFRAMPRPSPSYLYRQGQARSAPSAAVA
ncbi:hypothetical protein LGH83_17805 [Lichenihabitans sp. PAMC28606]|uniref:hypothetical protein n=1 Tax=Lichenihabitans sp. PAMC28606 TaxID=2880932 RepID=UPI001D0A4583|nr:hypothetical protein [Lichenihabitans sp. PAMC28606]UDL94345.1 hypothetical protein LGH83_17805 [Lichenihabitans sp. PAMC28606]